MYADYRGLNGKDRLLVIFYGGAPRQGSEMTLRRSQEKAVLTYLRTKGVSPQKVDVVTTKKKLEAGWLPQADKSHRPVASVELTVGCG